MGMRRVTARLLMAVGLATVLLAVLGVIALSTAGRWMQVHDEPRRADWILPLAGDASRWLYAAELYERGLAPGILISRPVEQPPSEVDRIHSRMGYPDYDGIEPYARAFYAELGVPDEALTPFGNGHVSTVEEAEALREFLGPGEHTILAVTSPFHARRAKLILERTLPEADIVMTVTPYEHFDAHWWADYRTAPKVVLEAAKCVFYALGGAFRSDVGKAPSAP